MNATLKVLQLSWTGPRRPDGTGRRARIYGQAPGRLGPATTASGRAHGLRAQYCVYPCFRLAGAGLRPEAVHGPTGPPT